MKAILFIGIGIVSFGSSLQRYYESSSRPCHAPRPMKNERLDWKDNLICNGYFSEPKVTKNWQHFKTIPCWEGTHNIEVGQGQFYGTEFLSQVMELDSNKPNQAYRQTVNIKSQGYFDLKFSYAARASFQASESSFAVYFNDHLVTQVRPTKVGIVVEAQFTVYGKFGDNTLEFVDISQRADQHAVLIDNVLLVPWKSNEYCFDRNS